MILRKDAPLIFDYMVAETKKLDIRDLRCCSWRDIICEVLESLGKKAKLAEIYNAVEPYEKAKRNQNWEAKVRQTLQRYQDFASCERGVWYLAYNQQRKGNMEKACILLEANEEFSACLLQHDGTLLFSTDGASWSTEKKEMQSKNGRLYLRGRGNTYALDLEIRSNETCRIKLSGNIESLLDFETVEKGRHPVMGACTFARLFSSSCITDASALKLPATTLAKACYEGMFCECTSLTAAPELPATTLAEGCYSEMFRDCASLTKAPELPATTLAAYCYSGMFRGCTSLTAAPELPAITLAKSCYGWMFNDCVSLTAAPELPATTLAEGCYEWMFRCCTSLTKAPELPATTLAENCYSGMFRDCALLTVAKMSAITGRKDTF